MTDWLPNWQTDWLIDWQSGLLIDWLVDKVTDWLIHRFSDQFPDWHTCSHGLKTRTPCSWLLTCLSLLFLIGLVACQERSNDVSWKIIQENDNRVSYGIIVNCLTFNSECLCLVFMSISCLWASHLSLSSGLLQTEQQQRNYLGFQASYFTAITLTLQKTGNRTILEHVGIESFLIEHSKTKTQVITNLAYKNSRDCLNHRKKQTLKMWLVSALCLMVCEGLVQVF